MRHRGEPFADEHRASKVRRMAPPKNLLNWFLEGFRAEMPIEMHVSGVWRDRVTADEERNGLQAVGGSVLGTPRTEDLFRRLLEDSPFATEFAEYEGHRDPIRHYIFPMRAALARLTGWGKDTDPYPFMGRTLWRTVLRDGDYVGACASMGIPGPAAQVYIDAALARLWARYETEPPATTIREVDAA